MPHEPLHEPRELLTPRTLVLRQAVVSVIEELDAINWYAQRADACGDEALKAILLHNLEEEIEHAAMALEWLRRNDERFDRIFRTYLFTAAPITEIEEAAEAEEAPAPASPTRRFTVGRLGNPD